MLGQDQPDVSTDQDITTNNSSVASLAYAQQRLRESPLSLVMKKVANTTARSTESIGLSRADASEN